MEEYSQNLEKNLEDLEMEVETLNAMINELLRRVSKEKDKGLQTLPEVEKWISMAEETESKASSLLDESISECHDLSTYDDGSKISESTLHYSEMVCMTLKEVKALRSQGVFKELAERPPLSHVKMMLPLQPIVSREMLLEKVWKCLTENKCRTLGLYGMAGVGKTTLLTQIKKKFIEVRYVSIGLVLFVVVESEEVEGIQVAIMKRLGLDWRQRSEREKASEIYEFLNRMRFVLLLDGVQREGLDLACIGVPEPTRGNGCKIVFTTRFQEACRSKWVDAVEEVKCLSPEEACCFFQEIVGETTLKSHPDIPQLARIVARKCGGLPIALSLIGESMSHKRTVREWHHAIHVLVSPAAEFSGMEAELLPILKFAYDNLPGENIRLCFLYCALFPKDGEISKQDLADCWIGEGLIEEEDRELAEIQGYEMIGDLVRMRLLMDNESGYGVKMHGMVREMALWIASDFGRQKENFVVVGGAGIQQMPEVSDWRKVSRLSVTCTRIENISDFPACSELKTLLLQGNNNLKWISGDFFRCRTSLVVLNLSRNRELSELPEEVSSLVSLRLLNLSWTWIKRLPLGLKELKRLMHLDLDDTPLLREIDVIGYLLNLQVLRLFWSVPMDHSFMEDIQLLKSLKELSLTVREADVLKRLLSIHQLSSCIRRLHLSWITDGGILLLNSLLSLRELNIEMCDIPEITIQRETLHFGNIEKIPHLQNICTVTLSWCKGIKDLTWLLFAPNLGDLKIHECQQIERIINKEKAPADMSEQPFHNLTRLSLDSLPQLESIYWTPLPFPVLEYLYVTGCPKLTADFDCQEWVEVEWEDEATKQRFSDIDDRDFPTMAEDPHPVENIVLLETLESGKSTTTNSITGEKVFQSGKDATMEHTQTYMLTPDAMSGIKKNTPGSSGSGVSSKTNRSTVPSSLSINSDRTLESLPTPRTEGEILSSLNLKAFTFNELKSATKNFRRESLLGEGGFGYVCKGWIDEVTCTASRPGRGICVAVKKLKTEGFQGHKEWLTEVNYLGRFSHPNLVKLVGYCIEGEDRLLVYEFMPKGSLENHLFSRDLQPLTWGLRMKVAIGAAKGLTFLHEAESEVMYRDFKAAKILLDSDFNAKLSDFGLAKAGPTGDRTQVSTHVMGTHGYAAPEYVAAGHLTTKSDVYSFGVVLVELLSGRRAVDMSKVGTEQSLVDWATPYLRHKRKLFRIMDPRLKGQYPQKEAYRAASLALQCLNPNPNFRPKMLEVRAKLKQLESTI